MPAPAWLTQLDAQVGVGLVVGKLSAAIVVCIALLLPFSAPYLGLNSTSNLPPCCRVNGKHHCAMMARLDAADQRGESRFRAAIEACPYRSQPLAGQQATRAQVTALTRQQFVLTKDPALPAVPAPPGQQQSNLHWRPKRGPPNFS